MKFLYNIPSPTPLKGADGFLISRNTSQLGFQIYFNIKLVSIQWNQKQKMYAINRKGVRKKVLPSGKLVVSFAAFEI